jgi:6-phosphogluconolactonase
MPNARPRPIRRTAAILLAALASACAAGRAPESPAATGAAPPRARGQTLYLGTYTDSGSRGIYRSTFEAGSGALTAPVLAAEAADPSFLALGPGGSVLYAVNEVSTYEGASSGAVSAYAVDPQTGALTLLGERASGGADPCHLAVDRAGRNLLVANYTGGSVTVFPLAGDGRPGAPSTFLRLTGHGPNLARQQGPHAHQVVLDPAERFALVADLGSDRVMVYRYDAARGALTPNDPPAVVLPPGAGPRHLAWHPRGGYAYVLSELASTVTVMRWDAERGVLEAVQTVSTLPAGFSGSNTAAEVASAPDGRFVYASNRGDDSIATFAVAVDGSLVPAGRTAAGGRTPRHFAIDPTGRWMLVANQDSDGIVVFRLDPATGLPIASGRPVSISHPVCVVFAAAVPPITPG